MMNSKKRKVFFNESLEGCGINYQNNIIQIEVEKNDIIVDDVSKADIIIFSGTCACTMSQTLATVNHMMETLEKVENRSKVKVYLTGCLTRSFRIKNEFFNNIENWINKNIDVIIPHNEPYKLLSLLYPTNSKYKELKDVFGQGIICSDYALLYMSNGCNNRCTFCKINYQEWPLKSIGIAEAKKWIDALNDENSDIKHLTLVGANLAQYGYDIDKKYHLPEIIEYIEDKENIESFFLGGFAVSDAVRLGFHNILRDSTKLQGFGGSLESGSNRILKLMNKGITIEEYIDFIKCIKSKKDKELFLSIIAGFPTETMEDVRLTLEALKEIAPTDVDICRYTDSPFIPSHNYEQLSPDTIQEHARIYSKVLQRRKINSNIFLDSYKNNGR